VGIAKVYTRAVGGRAERQRKRAPEGANAPFLLSLGNEEGETRTKRVLCWGSKENETVRGCECVYLVIILRVCKRRYDAYRISVIFFRVHARLESGIEVQFRPV